MMPDEEYFDLSDPNIPVFNMELGELLREEGTEAVKASHAEWFSRAWEYVLNLPVGWVGLPEDWRPPIIFRNGPPHDFHVWGSLTLSAIRAHLIEETGIRRKTQSVSSHAAKGVEYRRI